MEYQQTIDKLKEHNYNIIIETFEDLLFQNDNDLKKVSMNEVAKHANLTKRTIYKYFVSKDELYYEVMIRGYRVMHRYLEVSKHSAKGTIQLIELFKAFYDYSKQYPNYYNIIMNYKARKDDFTNPTDRITECYSLGQVTMQYMINAIESGVNDSDFRQDLNIIESTLLVWSFATGLLSNMSQKLDYVHEYYNIDRDAFIDKGIEAIIQLLR